MRLFRALRALFLLVFLTTIWIVGVVTGVVVALVIVLGLSSPEGRERLEEFRGSLGKLWGEVKKQLTSSQTAEPGPQ